MQSIEFAGSAAKACSAHPFINSICFALRVERFAELRVGIFFSLTFTVVLFNNRIVRPLYVVADFAILLMLGSASGIGIESRRLFPLPTHCTQ